MALNLVDGGEVAGWRFTFEMGPKRLLSPRLICLGPNNTANWIAPKGALPAYFSV
jgi:hypothetical protein